MKRIEIKLGNTIRLKDGLLLRAQLAPDGVFGGVCCGCYLEKLSILNYEENYCKYLECASSYRYDNNDVIFVKVEEETK